MYRSGIHRLKQTDNDKGHSDILYKKTDRCHKTEGSQQTTSQVRERGRPTPNKVDRHTDTKTSCLWMFTVNADMPQSCILLLFCRILCLVGGPVVLVVAHLSQSSITFFYQSEA